MAVALYYAKVVYNANGGSGVPAAQTGGTEISGGSVLITLSSSKPSRQYYTFNGWAYSSGASSGMSGGTTISCNASTTLYAANARVTNLYATWKPETAVLSYNANGGSGAPASQTVNKNTWFTLRTGVPTRSGYEFVGWNTSSTATAATYQPGDQARIVSNMTLYAVWKVSNSTISTISSSVPIDGSTQGSVSISSINNSYTHQLTLSIGESSQVISLAAGVTSATFTIPSSWLSEVPNSTTGTALASLKTFNGSTQVGGTDVKTFSITVPANIVPVITVATDYVNSNQTVDGWDILLQNFSQIKLTATASAGTGATVATFTFAGDGLSQTSASNEATSSVLTSSGSRSWTVTVTDSRG
ncbi:MAG: InlB B-repeat-containing protein, partial [Exiguobacterium sp.]|nr:InlB B-repeat-containing protein [Exiguobacterium sp.]